jgi:hypothetical protein
VKRSILERAVLPYGGLVPSVNPSILRRSVELLRACLFLPVTCFIWAVYVARIVYLVCEMWMEARLRVPSFPHQASPISSRAKKIFRFIEAMID